MLHRKYHGSAAAPDFSLTSITGSSNIRRLGYATIYELDDANKNKMLFYDQTFVTKNHQFPAFKTQMVTRAQKRKLE